MSEPGEKSELAFQLARAISEFQRQMAALGVTITVVLNVADVCHAYIPRIDRDG